MPQTSREGRPERGVALGGRQSVDGLVDGRRDIDLCRGTRQVTADITYPLLAPNVSCNLTVSNFEESCGEVKVGWC